MLSTVLRPYDRDALRQRYQSATPFPHLVVEDFLQDSHGRACAAEYPTYAEARAMGNEFSALNERLKVQVCDSEKFQTNVKQLHDALASQEFLDELEYITGIPKLLSDAALDGAGMHTMGGGGGRLDVHVDFNFLERRQWFRRLNILVYLNEEWDQEWGGVLELWNKDVTERFRAVPPKLGRCVLFETSDISYHGVTPLTAPPEKTRKSFAAYYYTVEPPPGWTGEKHSTVFRHRPTEKFRGVALAPAEKLSRAIIDKARGAGSKLKRLLRG